MYQVIILGFILIITLYVLKRMREPKLNMPPLVRYKFPIIGHTYSYLYNTEEFLKQCRKEVLRRYLLSLYMGSSENNCW
ncbi:hypothetical protein RhiirA4_489477 [Rhizophagus irregularis]|uniref:Cytochrome P450 n=1 Tax=Rhizophagus irregularis TaxID=588596 RepID=A0A2I1HUU2_9GLOM|nr:hypothetical protein RhiirA4_489477 [Rhizophagus irregularis]